MLEMIESNLAFMAQQGMPENVLRDLKDLHRDTDEMRQQHALEWVVDWCQAWDNSPRRVWNYFAELDQVEINMQRYLDSFKERVEEAEGYEIEQQHRAMNERIRRKLPVDFDYMKAAHHMGVTPAYAYWCLRLSSSPYVGVLSRVAKCYDEPLPFEVFRRVGRKRVPVLSP